MVSESQMRQAVSRFTADELRAWRLGCDGRTRIDIGTVMQLSTRSVQRRFEESRRKLAETFGETGMEEAEEALCLLLLREMPDATIESARQFRQACLAVSASGSERGGDAAAEQSGADDNGRERTEEQKEGRRTAMEPGEGQQPGLTPAPRAPSAQASSHITVDQRGHASYGVVLLVAAFALLGGYGLAAWLAFARPSPIPSPVTPPATAADPGNVGQIPYPVETPIRGNVRPEAGFPPLDR